MQLINEDVEVKAGDTLYDKNPAFGFRPVTVTRVTRTQIIVGNATYTRNGALKTDTYRRQRLYKHI